MLYTKERIKRQQDTCYDEDTGLKPVPLQVPRPKNGSRVLAAMWMLDCWKVLCWWPQNSHRPPKKKLQDADGNLVEMGHPFVCWTMDSRGYCESGHHFNNLNEAMEYWKENMI